MSAKNNQTEAEPNLRHFLQENISVMFGVDRRIFPTLNHLLFSPGKLTREYISGETQAFTPPTTLYFTINLLFFLLLPIVNSGGVKLFSFSYENFVNNNEGPIAEMIIADMNSTGLPEAVYIAQFDSFIRYNQPALIFIIIPFLIGILSLLNIRQRSRLLSHTVYAFHFMSFYLVTFLLFGALANGILPLIRFMPKEDFLLVILPSIPLLLYALWTYYYLFKSISVVYAGPIWISLVKAIFLLVSLVGLLFLYTRLLLTLSIMSVN